MEKSNGKKRKIKRTFLTVSKKSERYRLSHSVSNKSIVKTVQSDTESSSARESETGTQCHNETQIHARVSTSHKSVHCKPDTTDKSTKNKISQRNFCVQSTMPVDVKGIQTVKPVDMFQNQSSQCSLLPELPSDIFINELRKDDVLEKFIQNLADNEQTDKFIRTIKSLANGIMPFMNLAWKSCLDMGNLFSLKSTTTMEYDAEFCQVLYHMFGARVINALHGQGHFSTVTGNKTCKGKYKPSDGKFNFPVPSIPTLKKLDIGFPSEIPVGFVTQSLEIAEQKAKEGREFILSFDGKLIAPSCKGELKGDANLWGLEGPPMLSQSLKVLNNSLSAAHKINVDMRHTETPLHFAHLRELLHVSSR